MKALGTRLSIWYFSKCVTSDINFDNRTIYKRPNLLGKRDEEFKSIFWQNGKRLNDSIDSIDIRGKKCRGFYWDEYLEELNITSRRRMMNTRHTFAIHCIRNMESLKISINKIATMMGHSSLRMIISHYGKYMIDKNNKINREMSIYQDENQFTDYSTDSMENSFNIHLWKKWFKRDFKFLST